LLSTV